MWSCWHIAAVILLLVGLLTGVISKDCDSESRPETPEARLERELLCNYDSDQRPVKIHSTSVNVTVRVVLKYVEYQNNEEILQLNTWLFLTWTDEYLTWDPKDYEEVSEIEIKSYKIWTPELTEYNEDMMPNMARSFYASLCMVDSLGNVVCMAENTYSVQCISRLKYWPYDTQNCTLRFGSWIHLDEKINYTTPKNQAVIQRDSSKENRSWKVMNITATRDPGIMPCCPNDSYPSLIYNVIIERQSGMASAVIVVPAVVMVSLSILTLLVDINSSERLYLPLVNIFCHFMYMNELNNVIPQHGSESPLVVLFFRDSLLVTSFIVSLTILLRRLNIKTKTAPRWVLAMNSTIYTGPARHIVFNTFDPSDLESVVTEDVVKQEQFDKKEWRKLCAFVNNITLLVVVVTYAILFLALIC